MQDMEGEIWLPITETNNIVFVSNMGRVRNIDFIVKGHTYKSKIRKQCVGKIGYCTMMLHNGVNKLVKIHRLVAQAFIPNPDNKPHINHINGIKTDNRVENLEWVTNYENYLHAALVLKKNCIKSFNPKRFKPTKYKVFAYLDNQILFNRYESITQASAETKVSKASISKSIKLNKYVDGFIFSSKKLTEFPPIPIPKEKKVYQKIPTEINKTHLNRKKVFVYNLNGELIFEAESVYSLCNKFNLKDEGIRRAIKNNTTHKGYAFKYEKFESIPPITFNPNNNPYKNGVPNIFENQNL